MKTITIFKIFLFFSLLFISSCVNDKIKQGDIAPIIDTNKFENYVPWWHTNSIQNML